MTIERKVGMGIAGQPSGGATDVAEVFSTDLWDGTYYNQNGAATTINNGIDLAGEGGLVWLKTRVVTGSSALYDTGRGANSVLFSTINNPAQSGSSDVLGSFTSTGFVTGANGTTNGAETASENSGNRFVSWTFRKKEKFFDIVTFTGNSSTQTIAHGLGGPVGMIIIKTTSHTDDWNVWHRSIPTNHLRFDTAAKRSDITGGTAPTDTHFTLNSNNGYNGSGRTYVAYVFADNSSEDADDQMIKCGGFTGNATVNLGWEPQFVLYKKSNNTSHWFMLDTMRGWEAYRSNHLMNPLRANQNNAEYSTSNYHYPTSTGIQFGGLGGSDEYIYMAIRAPMMVEPEAATDVFAVDAAGSGALPAWVGGFPVDFALYRNVSSAVGTGAGTRMLGTGELFTNNNAAIAGSGAVTWDFSNGFYNSNSRSASYYSWMWKRAKGCFDVVAYSGSGSAKNVAHSLGVAPEMMWVKKRSGAEGWAVYHKLNGGTHFARLESASGYVANNGLWNNTNTTASVFRVGSDTEVNQSGQTYIAYLFASLAGISKVGSYSGNAANNHVINCGFSAGARFVLIKRSDGAGDWFLFDSVRGITSTSNDGVLYLNNTNAQATEAAAIGADAIQPHASGFKLGSDNTINHGEMEYIFYAIA